MSMPKTAVDEDNLSPTGKHNIRSTGKILAVKPETIT
jgi:hypothetical protein